MKEHWRLVFSSMLDGIYCHWRDTKEDMSKEVINAFELQDQSEIDDIDLDHYLETNGV